MPAETLVSYERVAEVAETLLVKNVKPTVDAVIAFTGGRRDYVRRHLKTWRLKNKAEREALIVNAFSENLKAAFVKDREDFSRSNNAIQREEIEILEYECTSMEDELSGLYSDRDALNDLLNSERESHAAKFIALEKSNFELNSTLASTRGEAEKLQRERDEAKDRRVAAEKTLLGLRITLAQRNTEVKAELSSAQKQIQEAKTERDNAKAAQEAAQKAMEQLKGQILELSSQVGKLQGDILSETLRRIKTEELLAAAMTTTATPHEDHATLTETTAAPSSQKKTSAKAQVSQAPAT